MSRLSLTFPQLLSITCTPPLIFYYFCFSVPPPCDLFSYFSALTGNGFACHVTLVTDCVMDGILVRALLCLRHAAGQKPTPHHHHPATSRSTCHAPHPAHVTPYYLGFSLPASPFFRATLPRLSIHLLAFHSRLALFVFPLCISLPQTVHHCLLRHDSLRICISPSV